MPLREPLFLRETDHGVIAQECTNKGRALLIDFDMDYEKKYKEIMERARRDYEAYKSVGDGLGVDALESIFPELRESENERVRKAIIELIHRTPSGAFESNAEFGFVGATHNEMLAYLEKQKESLHISESHKENANSFTNKDDRMRELIIDRIRSAEEMTEGLRELLLIYLEKLKEQKPCEDSGTGGDIMQYIEEGKKRGIKEVISFPEKYGLQKRQKPAEWSEEDERMRNQLIYDVKQHKEKCLISAKQNKATKAIYDGIEKCQDEKIAWLKSLSPQPKQEWSEEDEKFFELLRSALYQIKVRIGKDEYDRAVVRLKSLRPSWKPSEEDLEIIPLMIAILKQNYRPDSMFGRSGKVAIQRDCLIARLESLDNHINNL